MKPEIKTSIDNLFSELNTKTDYELRGDIYAIGILAASLTSKYVHPDDQENYKEVYTYIYDQLHEINIRINENTATFKITAEFTSRGQRTRYHSSFVERTYDDAVKRFAARIKANYRISRNISYSPTINEQ